MQIRHLGRILLIALLASLCWSACKCKQKQPPVQVPIPVVQAPPLFSEERQWVNKVVSQYSEIAWLANADVSKTQESPAVVDKSYSEQLYGQKFIEFDRSLLSLRCLKLILSGSEPSYQEFTAAQPENVRLSKESFQMLHEQGMTLLKAHYQNMFPAEMQQAMETALVLGNIGKSDKARKIFQQFGAQAPNPDDFYGQAMGILKNNPRLSRSFSRLSYSSKQLLIKVAHLVPYREVTHLEGGPSLFTQLKHSHIAATDPTALSFALFIYACDVAGALGHDTHTSSLMYTEPTHQALQAMARACHVLSDPTQTEADAYDAYLHVRASWLGLDPTDREDRVLTRMGAMLRLFTPEEGAALKNGILSLSPEDRERIVAQLDVRFGQEVGRPPLDLPTVLINLYHNTNLGATPTERLSQAVTRGLSFIAKVLEQHQAHPEISLNFNKVATLAQSMPDLLQTKTFTIEANGNIAL